MTLYYYVLSSFYVFGPLCEDIYLEERLRSSREAGRRESSDGADGRGGKVTQRERALHLLQGRRYRPQVHHQEGLRHQEGRPKVFVMPYRMTTDIDPYSFLKKLGNIIIHS